MQQVKAHTNLSLAMASGSSCSSCDTSTAFLCCTQVRRPEHQPHTTTVVNATHTTQWRQCCCAHDHWPTPTCAAKSLRCEMRNSYSPVWMPHSRNRPLRWFTSLRMRSGQHRVSCQCATHRFHKQASKQASILCAVVCLLLHERGSCAFDDTLHPLVGGRQRVEEHRFRQGATVALLQLIHSHE